MIELQIPGWGHLEIQNLVLDFNGTLATDGTLIEGVAQQLCRLHEQGVNIYVITADTNGTVRKECEAGSRADSQHRKRKKRPQDVLGKCAFDCGAGRGGSLRSIGATGGCSGYQHHTGTGAAAEPSPPESNAERVKEPNREWVHSMLM